MMELYILLAIAMLAGAGVIALALCKISGGMSEKERQEEIDRLINEGRG